MSKLGRLWDWLLPGLISLSPMGAIAYYNSGYETEARDSASAGPRRRAQVRASRRPVVVHPVRL
jgi:hypothetical protein